MKTGIGQFVWLTRLTAQDIIRQPITMLMLLSSILLIALLPLLITYRLEESGRIVRDSALAVHFISGLLLAGFASATSLAREFRTGTVAAILSKPLNRTLFFIAKFAGTAWVLLLFSLTLNIAVMLSTRAGIVPFQTDWKAEIPLLMAPFLACAGGGIINFYTGRPFPSITFKLLLLFLAAGFLVSCIYTDYDLRIIPLGLLITLALLVFAALSVSLASRFQPATVLGICMAVFFAGLMSDYFFGRFAENCRAAALIYAILPNWQRFWMADAVHGNESISWRYVSYATLYAFLFLTGILTWGAAVFQRLEIGQTDN